MPTLPPRAPSPVAHYVVVCTCLGTIHYRGEEISQTARMLTMLALYYSYTGDQALLLTHFPKAKGIADWLLARRAMSLSYPKSDARCGCSCSLGVIVQTGARGATEHTLLQGRGR